MWYPSVPRIPACRDREIPDRAATSPTSRHKGGGRLTQRVTALRCQRLAIVVSGEQNFFAVKVGKRHIGGESLLGVNQDVRRFWRVGCTRVRNSRNATPSQWLSKRLQRVTQWKSLVRWIFGNALNSFQFSRSGVSTNPVTRRSQVSALKLGTEP